MQVFFRWLARQNLVLFNPAADIELPKVRRELPKDVLSAAEAEAILAQPDVARPLFATTPDTGRPFLSPAGLPMHPTT